MCLRKFLNSTFKVWISRCVLPHHTVVHVFPHSSSWGMMHTGLLPNRWGRDCWSWWISLSLCLMRWCLWHPGQHLTSGLQLEGGHVGRSRQGGARAGNHGRWRSGCEAACVAWWRGWQGGWLKTYKVLPCEERIRGAPWDLGINLGSVVGSY